MTITLVILALFGALSVVQSGVNLREACKLFRLEQYTWMRHHLLISHIWSAAAVVIGAITVGALK